MKKIRLITLFSGYDSQALALKYLGVDFEHYKTCEWAIKSIQALKDLHFEKDNIDYSKNLSKEDVLKYLTNKHISSDYKNPLSYNQLKRLSEDKLRTIYNNIQATNNLVDITQVKGSDLQTIDSGQYDYIMTYSFPCQSLSLAGNRDGMDENSGTTSSLLWQVKRILQEINAEREYCLPQILIMENVPQVHSSKNKENFDKWCNFLESLGYKNYYKDLNAKNFGIPQNRNRCFMISLLGNNTYEFPQEIILQKKLKDLLENNVEEKYFLSDRMKIYVTSSCDKLLNKNMVINREIACTEITREGVTRTESEEKLCPTLDTRCDCLGVVVSEAQKGICNKALDFLEPTDIIDYSYTKARQNELDNGYIKTKNKKDNEVMNTITTYVENFGCCVDVSNGIKDLKVLRIRKLTPKECFRLMGVKDSDFEKIAKNQSNASLYHLAGDSIVTNCLMAIFSKLLNIDYENYI